MFEDIPKELFKLRKGDNVYFSKKFPGKLYVNGQFNLFRITGSCTERDTELRAITAPNTLGARGFSCAISGVCHVSVVTRAKNL